MNLGKAQIHERKFFSVNQVTDGLFLYKIWQRLHLRFLRQPAFRTSGDIGSQKMGSGFG